MAALRAFLAVAVMAATASSPASAYWGGYRHYGYGYRGYDGFGAGVAPGGFYGGYYPRPYAYPAPYYLPPPVVYVPPPVFMPPAYAALPRTHRVVHRVRPTHPATPPCRCLQPMPSTVPAPLRDVPSSGP